MSKFPPIIEVPRQFEVNIDVFLQKMPEPISLYNSVIHYGSKHVYIKYQVFIRNLVLSVRRLLGLANLISNIPKDLPGLIDKRTPEIHYSVTFDSSEHLAIVNAYAIISVAV